MIRPETAANSFSVVLQAKRGGMGHLFFIKIPLVTNHFCNRLFSQRDFEQQNPVNLLKGT